MISPRTMGTNRDSVEKFLEKRRWPEVRDDQVSLIALNADGRELGRLIVPAVPFEGSSRQVADFIKAHAPARTDAKDKWEAALAEARKTGRRVWVRNSQTRCAPCFTLSRWFHEQGEILQKDYVMLKIDIVRDGHGAEMCDFIGAASSGVPYHAIFSGDGKKVVDSIGPLGNIGDPSGFEGLEHMRLMIKSTARRITDAEIMALMDSLERKSN